MDTRVVSIGNQDFEDVIAKNDFYVDKTHFIKEWWESRDSVTLITRPRRFGKTLLMSMVEKFFSLEYREKSYLFEGLRVFEEDRYRELQGTYPVISLSFASVKENRFESFYKRFRSIIGEAYLKKDYLKIRVRETEPEDYTESLYSLSDYLYRFHGKKPIILLDEYDTPMQEAYLNGYWDEMISFIRNLFNAAFKANPYLERRS